MRLVILDDYDLVSEWAAKYVRNKILAANPGPDNYFVLGLPTGMFQYSFILPNTF
jgi:glucosamine-6-phosphate deaminase